MSPSLPQHFASIRKSFRIQEIGKMAVPKRKHSNARTGTRRSHDHKEKKQIMHCPECSYAIPTHKVCPKCGHYMGRPIVEPKED